MLSDFFHPSSIAVVGASRKEGKGGNIVTSNILEFGFKGRIYPVNPSAGEILGLKAYPSLEALPEVPGLVVAVLPREQTLGLVRECTEKGVRSVIIPAAGFSDAGIEGRRLEKEIIGVTKAAGIRVMGPNSIGTVCTSEGVATSIVTLDKMRSGRISLFGQTGMFSSGIARWIDSREYFGISKIACLGNKADINESDLLTYLGDDEETGIIGVYTEGVEDGRRFTAVLREVSEKKPVLLLKSGRTETGRRAIETHTGALSGSEEVYEGVIAQAGAIRVRGFQELFDCAKAFEMQPLPRGNRVGVVSITGVGCVLAADSSVAVGLELPPLESGAIEKMREALPGWAPVANPVDVWAGIEAYGPEKTYNIAAHAVVDDEAVDSLMVIFTLIPESAIDVVSLFTSLREAQPEKPLAAVLMAGDAAMQLEWRRSLESVGIPTYPWPERALRAIGAMWQYASRRRTAS